MSESKSPSPNSGIGRFVFGFLLGGLSGIFGALLCDQQHFLSALIFGLVIAVIIGAACALLGKRVSDFIIELITRFPG